ncbi:hypothetical protein BCR44DRAFT_1156340 [Catenaria anguillulae PL171]|uniref:Uncharacterized protein n=1 Tax=Catenaria anguillulae PL171 TaxID=765915 RepID=A0A1Y2HI60_9FUNG|nr:hypothetical protein BCR44DRAFT_1156340 [Catenaria anguillulae PL171]
MVRVFNTGPAKFASLSTLAISGAFFCTVDSSPRIFNVFARSLPNLIDLDLVGVQVAPDAFLASMDCLLRRKPGVGKPLTDLSVSFQVVPQYPFPLTTTRSGLASDTFKYSVATASDLRTPLNMCRATPNHLRVLTLTVDGPGYDDIGAFQIPSLAMHPGLLHGIHKMTLFSIKLFVLPLPYSHPKGPSVLPIDCIIHPAVKTAPLTHRTPIDWAHLTLRNLRTLSLTSKSILANVFSTSKSVTADFHRMPAHLPSCPALDAFDVAADDPLAAFDASTVGRTLTKYPRLIHARVGPTSMSKRQLEWLADKMLSSTEDKVLGRWPRMRDLVLYNSEAGEQVDRGLVASSAHVSDLAAAAAATLAPELVIRLRYDNAWAMSALECAYLGAGKKIGCDPMLSTCGGCGKFVKHIRNPSSARTLEVNTAYAKETGLVKKRDAILTTDPRCSCAKCAVDREYMRFGNGMYGMRSGRVGQVYYLWKEGSRYPMLVE